MKEQTKGRISRMNRRLIRSNCKTRLKARSLALMSVKRFKPSEKRLWSVKLRSNRRCSSRWKLCRSRSSSLPLLSVTHRWGRTRPKLARKFAWAQGRRPPVRNSGRKGNLNSQRLTWWTPVWPNQRSPEMICLNPYRSGLSNSSMRRANQTAPIPGSIQNHSLGILLASRYPHGKQIRNRWYKQFNS